MTPAERAALEEQAERALRRGELALAGTAYRTLLAAFPDDPSLSRRLQEIQELLDPAELVGPPRGAGEASRSGPQLAPEQEGELLFASGDYLGAAAAYRRALTLKPDSELIQERLLEIFQLARATTGTSRPGRAPAAADRESLLRRLLDRVSARRRPAQG